MKPIRPESFLLGRYKDFMMKTLDIRMKRTIYPNMLVKVT